MTREQLEHTIRAVADITGKHRLIVIGSQAILGQFPDAPEELLISREADIYAPESPELSELITGTIGEGTHFERTHTYFARAAEPKGPPDRARTPRGGGRLQDERHLPGAGDDLFGWHPPEEAGQVPRPAER